MRTKSIDRIRHESERGIALVVTMMVMMLMAALMIGFTTAVTSDQRYRQIDRDRVKAFYGALSGLEKLNTDLANLFFVHLAPSSEQIAELAEDPPDIEDVIFASEGEGAYGVTYVAPAEGESEWGHISSGPFEGLIALKKKYTLDSTVTTTDRGEAHLRRHVETVAIPVFQFGLFSEPDLSFHAGANFNFGGRIHTNANLYLAQGGTTTLTLSEKVTAVQEIYRVKLVNGRATSETHPSQNIRVATSTGSYRNLRRDPDEGSANAAGSANSSWPTLSLSTYNGYIRDGTTGAKRLDLPVITSGGSNADLVRRPPVGENDPESEDYNLTLFGERMFTQASVRILLSDTEDDILNLPTVTATAPIQLDGDWRATPPAGYGPVDATHPPIARSEGLNTVALTVNPAGGAGITLTVAAVPNYFRPAGAGNLTITEGANTYRMVCTGRATDGVNFTGCTVPDEAIAVTIDDDSPVTATIDGATIQTRISGVEVIAPAVGANVTVDSTANFARDTFWLRNNLITCSGNTATTFLGCNNVPSAADVGDLVTTSSASNAGTGLIGGFIKIEMQDSDGDWTDITAEILNYGIAGPNLTGGRSCGDPTPDAILRFQRLRDNQEGGAGTCSYASSQKSIDYWPNVVFDAREALQRDVSPGSNPLLGGVMHYVALDVANLKEWFEGTGAYDDGSGPDALSIDGYAVYFSDRRNNRNVSNDETGEYGFEDVINSGTDGGAPNDELETGEDVNASTTLDTYGQLPSFNGAANSVPPGAVAPLDLTARPTTAISRGLAQVNRAILFRRALKLINGGLGSIPEPGFSIMSENPVYVHGDWNANTAGFGNPHVATALIADAVTILSNSWSDNISFSQLYAPGSRVRAADSYYRFAVIAGKNAPFPYEDVVGAKPDDFGTDGGAHNFLRMLEGGGGTVNYRGSIATFYYSRQATGIYKCCNTVYGAPTRNFNFDTDFLDPAKLPPLTPVFRDLNALGFEQETRPGR
jgi:hypothetical protein